MPGEVVDITKKAVTDTVGVALAGSVDPVGNAMSQLPVHDVTPVFNGDTKTGGAQGRGVAHEPNPPGQHRSLPLPDPLGIGELVTGGFIRDPVRHAVLGRLRGFTR